MGVSMESLLLLEQRLNQVILGKSQAVRHLLAAILAGGHVLIEDVPGTGKTTLARHLAQGLGAEFKRIQFTPDMMPGDILGGAIYDPRQGDFRIVKGPIFAEILLADEINRATPRTQSALLEAMEEAQVSLDGGVYPLPEFFLVLATENPRGFAGTHALPEAQLDRFLVRLRLGYPDADAELKLLLRSEPVAPVTQPTVNVAEILALRHRVNGIKIHPDLARYVVQLGESSRQNRQLDLGLSTRGLIALVQFAKALALLNGRDHVWPDDLQEAWLPVTAHRVIGPNDAETQEKIMLEVLQSVALPK